MKRFVNPYLPVVATLAFLFTFSCTTKIPAGSGAGLSADTLALAVQKMQSYIDSGKLSCISTLVIRDGEVADRHVYGYGNLGEERKLKEDAVFRIYSMSKPVTAAALMILYDEGKFQMDDPVAMYIPEFEDTQVWVDGRLVDQAEPVTIRHLLTHTAGLCYGWDPGSHVDSLYRSAWKGNMWKNGTLEDFVMRLARIPLKNQPGTKWEYSVSIDVAGYLVEVLSGLTFDEFLKHRLFGPLEMDDTGFQVPEEDFDRLAMIYTTDRETGELIPVDSLTRAVMEDVTLFSGGGGMVSTIEDYGKFGQMLLNGGVLDGVRVLEESTVKLIMSDQMPEGVTYQEGVGFGLAGGVNKTTGEYGWDGMASTSFTVDPAHHMVVLAFTQYIPYMGHPFARDFKALVRSAVPE
jgi:CubicO group peptidase (beta-lactamase class C family)